METLIFNLTIHHLWGLVLAKFPETRTIVYVDDGYMKTKLIVTLQVLSELKRVLKEDVDLQLRISKTTVLPKGVSQEDVFDESQTITNVNPPSLTLARMFVLILSVLKVSLVSVYLLVPMFCTQLCR